jgi:hypothetical protein
MLDAADDPLPGIKTVGLDGDLTVFDGITCEAGDANPSGGIDVGDAIVVLRVAAGLLTDPTGEQRCGADADRNGRIDTGDAVWILRRVVGLPVAKVPATAPSPRVALERVGDRARLRIEPADAVHGLELVLAGDGDLVPGVLGPASDGLRVESALDGRRRVAWAAAEALGAGPLLLDLPVDWSAGGVEGRLTLRSLRLFAADGRTMSASMERATLRLAKEVVGPRVLELTSAPNPFNPVTTLRFELARAGRSRLEIYNAAGARVDVLLDETLEVGAHEVAWNGTDRAGRPVASGVYFARLTTDGASARRRLLLVK